MNKFSVLLRKGYWCQGNLTFHIDIYVIVHCNEVFKIYSQNMEHTMFIFVKFRCDGNVFVYFKRESFCLRQLIYFFFEKKKNCVNPIVSIFFVAPSSSRIFLALREGFIIVID